MSGSRENLAGLGVATSKGYVDSGSVCLPERGGRKTTPLTYPKAPSYPKMIQFWDSQIWKGEYCPVHLLEQSGD